MYSKELLEKYADVLIEKGVNIQKGQYLLLQCCIDTLPLARIICEKALLITLNVGDNDSILFSKVVLLLIL